MKTSVLESLFNKVAGPATLLKRDSKQVFTCKICEIVQNTYFEEHLRWRLPVKTSYILKQTCNFQLQVCISMNDLLVDIRLYRTHLLTISQLFTIY